MSTLKPRQVPIVIFAETSINQMKYISNRVSLGCAGQFTYSAYLNISFSRVLTNYGVTVPTIFSRMRRDFLKLRV